MSISFQVQQDYGMAAEAVLNCDLPRYLAVLLRVANIHEVPFPRPRSLEIMATKEVFDLTNVIKMEIVGEQKSRYDRSASQVAAGAA